MYKTSGGQVFTQEEFEQMFPLVDPKELINHKILKHEPKNQWEDRLRCDIRKGLSLNLSAFRLPCMDPSEKQGKIVFESGSRPAVGHSAIWWKEILLDFMPSQNSRIGTDLHWAAFLGHLMKYLVVEKKYSVDDAWKAVCHDRRKLGYHSNSEGERHILELTGNRKLGNFFDISNTFKLVQKHESQDFYAAGGHYNFYEWDFPLTVLWEKFYYAGSGFDEKGVGLLVMDP